MKILHVNDVASVGSILVRASDGRDGLFQPTLRRDLGEGLRGGALAIFRMRDAWRMRRQFTSQPYTHLHVHYATFAFLADLARLPYSLHVHGGDVLLDLDHFVKRPLVLRAVRRARHVVVSTPDLLEPTRAVRTDAIYVPNPMDPGPSRVRVVRGGAPRGVLLSKMDRLKGWDRQLSVVAAIKKAIPGFTFSFFGHGQLPANQRARLSEQLTTLGGTVSSPLPREEYLRFIGSFDVAIGQMEVGSLGMSEMEAMARGVPTVADVTAHLRIGYEPPAIAPDSAADIVLRLWSEGEMAWTDFGQRGRDYVLAAHSPRRCLALLDQALGSVEDFR